MIQFENYYQRCYNSKECDYFAIFNNDFNEELSKETLEKLKEYKSVIFGKKFNKSIDNLPNNIKHIEIRKISKQTEFTLYPASDFDQPINNLPINLKTLCLFTNNFSHNLDFLPESLETLVFNNTNAIDTNKITYFNNLPINLKELILDITRFNSPLDQLPDNLEKLTITSGICLTKLDKLPRNLKTLKLDGGVFGELDNLPDLLEELIFKYVKFGLNHWQYILKIDSLPSSLKTITLIESRIEIIKSSFFDVESSSIIKPFSISNSVSAIETDIDIKSFSSEIKGNTELNLDTKYGKKIKVLISYF